MNLYRIIAMAGQSPPVVVYAEVEACAEEAGAAMALAGFTVKVYYKGNILHEFFPSTTE